MEMKEKTDKTRIKEKRLVQFQVIMRSQLIRGGFHHVYQDYDA